LRRVRVVALGQTADMPQCLGERRDSRGWTIHCILERDGHYTHRDHTGHGWEDDPNWTTWDEYDEDVALRCAELGWVPYVGNLDQARADMAEKERLHALYGVTGMTRQIDWNGATLAIAYWRRTSPGDREDITALVLAGERGKD
jgi:hypothetical protein